MTVGIDVDVDAVRGSHHGDGGVVGGIALLRFAEAVLSGDAGLDAAREAVVAQLGEAVMLDAAGIVATFEMMNRIANGTGTPLDPHLVQPTAELAGRVGATSFESATT